MKDAPRSTRKSVIDEDDDYEGEEQRLPIPMVIAVFVVCCVIFGYSYYTQVKGVEAGRDIVPKYDYVPTVYTPETPQTKAADWVRVAIKLPESAKRKKFMKDLEVALYDGEFSDAEFRSLSIDYATLTEHVDDDIPK